MRKLIVVTLVALIPLVSAGSAEAFSHKAFDSILIAYVRNGRVDYAGIKANAKDKLDKYVAAVAKARVGGSKKAQLAFYLNAYNALVIKSVVERWPNIKSVIKVPGFFKNASHTVAGRKVSLDQLEKKLILPKFKDARVHFALVCAARSCPPLRNRAFYGRGLDKVLDRLAAAFINGPHGVRVSGDSVKVSSLFKWYEGDFAKSAGSVGKFLAKYHKSAKSKLEGASSFGYLHYNWNLNKK
jgi:hypothetical protein